MINVFNPELRKSMLIRLEGYENFLVIEKEFPLKQEDCLAKNFGEEVSKKSESNRDEKEELSIIEKMTPLLPPLNRKGTTQERNL